MLYVKRQNSSGEKTAIILLSSLHVKLKPEPTQDITVGFPKRPAGQVCQSINQIEFGYFGSPGKEEEKS